MAGVLEGKTALITGAASGMGRATARMFAEEGARVALCDISLGGLEETQRLMGASGAQTLLCQVDLTLPESFPALTDRIEAEFGRLDILYNNAGVNHMAEIEDMRLADWERCFAVNIRAPFFMTKAMLSLLRKSPAGVIINISSTSGLKGKRYQCAYASSKAALVELTQCLANDLAEDGIRVLCICPGTVDTPMPQGVLADNFPPEEREDVSQLWTGGQLFQRWADPVEIAAVGLFLASDKASFMTGAIVPVDGGAVAR